MKKNTSERTERAALYGLLTALAMVLGFVESLIPIPFPVPGIRLGLANLVTVAGLYLVGIRGTAAVTVLRIVLTGLSFGNPYSMAYGLSGSLLSLLVMGAAKKRQWFSPVGISILGGIAHNVGQVSFAALSSVQQASFTICRRSWPPAVRPEPSSAWWAGSWQNGSHNF